MTQLQSGDRAPDFSLLDQHHEMVRLSDLRGKPVLLYFYPRANTPGCTKQSCNMRDLLVASPQAQIVGISGDTPERQLHFAQRYGLDFPLLCDEDHSVAQAYGVWREKLSFGKSVLGIVRSGFVISEDGTLLETWYKISPDETSEKFRAYLKETA